MTETGAIALTGVVLLALTTGLSAWVADASRGYDRKWWHRPVVTLGWLATGVVFIVAIWRAVP